MESSAPQNDSGITIVSIATGRYLSFWQNLVLSFEVNCEWFNEINWVLLTDHESDIQPDIRVLLDERLTVRYIPHSEWPFPTLLRYKYISEHKELLKDAYTLYLDADMRVISNISRRSISEFFDSGSMTFVRHPGYYRDKDSYGPMSISAILKDLFTIIRRGGLGAWDTNRNSMAFVPRSKRRIYLCGGIWGGPTWKVLEFVDLLHQRTDSDLSIGIIAKFHDESHLNWYAGNSLNKTESPKWCYESSYWNLSGLEGLIEAVNKNSGEVWVR